MEKCVMVNRFWSETPEYVLEEMKKKFPQLEEHFIIEKGVLSYLVHHREEYRIAFVFPLKSTDDASEQQMIYYPAKQLFVRSLTPQAYFPISVEPRLFVTKRGLMRVCECNNQMVVTFSTIYSKVVEGKH